jgi:hypothetical protein
MSDKIEVYHRNCYQISTSSIIGGVHTSVLIRDAPNPIPFNSDRSQGLGLTGIGISVSLVVMLTFEYNFYKVCLKLKQIRSKIPRSI